MTAPRDGTADGVLVVDKPGGLTSHDVVAAARRMLGERRIGHTGTLDPLATGVLPLACGRATRLVRFLTASNKSYDATIRFGLTTDTFDVTGRELASSPTRPTREAIEAGLCALRGSYLQLPPPVSAKKVGGTRAYVLARQGQDVPLTPVPVSVTRAEIITFDGERAAISLDCSAGFYVRRLAHDLGIALGTGASLETLRRTRSGEFTIAQAVPLDVLQQEVRPHTRLVPMHRLLGGTAGAVLTPEGYARVRQGQEIAPHHIEQHIVAAVSAARSLGKDHPTGDDQAEDSMEMWVRLLVGERLVAMARRRPSGLLHPAVVLN